MKRFLGWVVVGLMAGFGMVGCNLLGPTEETSPTITLDDIGSIDVGTFKNIEGKVTAGEEITQIQYEITTATGGSVSTITVEGPSSSSSDKIEFKDNDAIKITVSSSASAGDYLLKITATAGVTSSAEFDFTVTGSSAVTLTEKSGMIANIFGPDTGAFNLVDGKRVSASASDNTKDLMDLSLVGEGFAGELGSGNGAKFATATASDYTNATDVSVPDLAADADLDEIDVSTVGTVFVVKLGNSRGYAIVKITSYDADAGASTGENKGEVEFTYKFTD
jgi:hypothetical protein